MQKNRLIIASEQERASLLVLHVQSRRLLASCKNYPPLSRKPASSLCRNSISSTILSDFPLTLLQTWVSITGYINETFRVAPR